MSPSYYLAIAQTLPPESARILAEFGIAEIQAIAPLAKQNPHEDDPLGAKQRLVEAGLWTLLGDRVPLLLFLLFLGSDR